MHIDLFWTVRVVSNAREREGRSFEKGGSRRVSSGDLDNDAPRLQKGKRCRYYASQRRRAYRGNRNNRRLILQRQKGRQARGRISSIPGVLTRARWARAADRFLATGLSQPCSIPSIKARASPTPICQWEILRHADRVSLNSAGEKM